MFRVHGNDGNTHEAPSLAALQEWVNEGRVIQSTIVEDLLSGTEGPASAIEGLTFPKLDVSSGQQGSSAYPRAPSSSPDWAIHLPLVKAIIATLCCSPVGLVALIYAAKVPEILARGDRERAYKVARIANLWSNVALLSGFAWYVLFSKFLGPLILK